MKKFFISVYAFIYKTGLKLFGGKGLYKIWPFGAIYDALRGTLWNHNWPEKFEIDGHTIYPLPVQRAALAMYGGTREALEFELFRHEIPRGTTVIDVGANIGFYTLPFARAVGEHGHVFAFEPAPENLNYLKKNIKANGYKNVTVVEKAVGDYDSVIKLYLSGFNPGGHQIFDMREKIFEGELTDDRKALLEDEHSNMPRKSVEVSIVSLDAFLKDHPQPISFIKMDVEGAEGGVLRGMKKVLEKNKDIKLHFEFTPSQMRLFGTDPSEFLRELAAMEFTLYDLRNFKHAKNELPKITPEALLASCAGNHSAEIFAKRLQFYT